MSGGRLGFLLEQSIDTVVYSPPQSLERSSTPDLAEAEVVFKECVRANVKNVILLSSAAIYGASHHNTGLLCESHVPLRQAKFTLAHHWLELESLAAFYLGGDEEVRLVILRPAAVPLTDGRDYFSRMLAGRLAFTLAGHDPSLQFLSAEDLAGAVRRAVEGDARGIFNVAPDGVVPLRKALRAAGVRRVAAPRTLQRLSRSALAPARFSFSAEHLDYIRYSWTISNRKAKRELGFRPRYSSVETVVRFAAALRPANGAGIERAELAKEEFDDFGMDENYIEAFGRTLFGFLHDRYWRVEVDGLDQVPTEGRAVLVGVHRGFMPWDAVMTLHLLVQRLNRYPRFLIHPGLIRFPFLFNFHTKLGGVIACQENAERILERDEILAIYPEGIRGAFTPYRDAYRLGRFGRDEFVRLALRHRAPLVPFVNVGSAEIFPIIGKLNWNWWKRRTEWPFFPITPTWPLLPLPLPSKWHTQFLAPIHVERKYPPEAADDPATVREVSREVKRRMQESMDEMLRRRKSVFFGSIFERERNRRGEGAFEKALSYRGKAS